MFNQYNCYLHQLEIPKKEIKKEKNKNKSFM